MLQHLPHQIRCFFVLPDGKSPRFWYQNYWKLLKDIQVVYCVFASSVDSITIWAVLAKIYNGQKGEYFIRNQMPVTCMNNKIILVIVQKTTKKDVMLSSRHMRVLASRDKQCCNSFTGIQWKPVTGSLSLSTDKTRHCHLRNQQSGSCVQMLPCFTAAYYTIGCWLWEKLFETSI